MFPIERFLPWNHITALHNELKCTISLCFCVPPNNPRCVYFNDTKPAESLLSFPRQRRKRRCWAPAESCQTGELGVDQCNLPRSQTTGTSTNHKTRYALAFLYFRHEYLWPEIYLRQSLLVSPKYLTRFLFLRCTADCNSASSTRQSKSQMCIKITVYENGT